VSATPATPLPRVSAAPHIASKRSCRNIMLWVVVALLPATVWAVWNMGSVAVWLLVACIGSTVGTEWLWNRIARRPQTIWDGSALVTGLLLALALPPRTPWWMAVAGGIVAIALAKMLFGGLGWNLFNPALVGRAFISISWIGVLSAVQPFPAAGTTRSMCRGTGELDAITGATRLAIAAADRAADGAYGFDLSAQY
jgi:Na+-translocating ferredoxin:NAD+ oxidoreductase subunit D